MNIKNKCKISIAMPVYNGGNEFKKNIKRFVDECDDKKFRNFIEFVISDNASTDNTKKIVNYYKKKISKNKNIQINYFRKKKNVGFYKNFIGLKNLVSGMYILFLNDDDIPDKGFYNELFNQINNKKFEEMYICPTKNSRKYYKTFFGLTNVSYIINRGSITSGIILFTKNINYKFSTKTLYPQNELYLNYYLKFGMKDLDMKSIIRNVSTQKTSEKFNDRVNRKEDYAVFDKIKSVEKFYISKKINFLEFFISLYHIYKWSLNIKWSLHKEKNYKMENTFYEEIIKYKRKYMLTFIIFFLYLKNFFSKKRFFYYKALIIKLKNNFIVSK